MTNRADADIEVDIGDPDPTKIPPRLFSERVRLAIHWTRHYHDPEDDPDDDLGEVFIRELCHAGLKLVWLDGSGITKTTA